MSFVQVCLVYKITHIFPSPTPQPLPHRHTWSQGGTPLHYYVWTDSIKKEKTDFLVSLLTTAEVEVDCRTEDGNTPLHLAVKVCFTHLKKVM